MTDTKPTPEPELVAVLRVQLDGALRERDTNEHSRQRAVELQKQAESQCVRAQKERDEARAPIEKLTAENERLRRLLNAARLGLLATHPERIAMVEEIVREGFGGQDAS